MARTCRMSARQGEGEEAENKMSRKVGITVIDGKHEKKRN